MAEAQAWPPEEDFYDRFQRLWRHSSASAKDIAGAIGLKNERTLSNWSEPGRVPEAETVLLLADYFGVSYRWLLTGKGDPEPLVPERDP